MPKSVPNSAIPIQSIQQDWQQQLAQSITDPVELLDMLDLNIEDFPESPLATAQFPLRVPRSYVEKIEPGNIEDPLLKQVMACGLEMQDTRGFVSDPVGDLDAMPVPGLLHKYHGRVLLVTTGACAIHCRYCFRRHFPYSDNHPGHNHWQDAIDYIQQRPEISEVILSGGDPLVLSDQKLSGLLERLNEITHLKRLRIHTRLPVVLPARITQGLIDLLKTVPLNTSIVTHVNHSREITAPEQEALQNLRRVGITLLNQSVLLKGINDDLESQVSLCETLYQQGVLPYYLHLLDPVQGAAHFEVNEDDAVNLVKSLRSALPGYLVPQLVREKPGENSKTPIFGL